MIENPGSLLALEELDEDESCSGRLSDAEGFELDGDWVFVEPYLEPPWVAGEAVGDGRKPVACATFWGT